MGKKHRAYDEVRKLVESWGGRMFFIRGKYQWGAWCIELNGQVKYFPSNGKSFVELDHLYEPKIPNPQHHSDYFNILHPNAEAEFLALITA